MVCIWFCNIFMNWWFLMLICLVLMVGICFVVCVNVVVCGWWCLLGMVGWLIRCVVLILVLMILWLSCFSFLNCWCGFVCCCVVMIRYWCRMFCGLLIWSWMLVVIGFFVVGCGLIWWLRSLFCCICWCGVMVMLLFGCRLFCWFGIWILIMILMWWKLLFVVCGWRLMMVLILSWFILFVVLVMFWKCVDDVIRLIVVVFGFVGWCFWCVVGFGVWCNGVLEFWLWVGSLWVGKFVIEVGVDLL